MFSALFTGLGNIFTDCCCAIFFWTDNVEEPGINKIEESCANKAEGSDIGDGKAPYLSISESDSTLLYSSKSSSIPLNQYGYEIVSTKSAPIEIPSVLVPTGEAAVRALAFNSPFT